MALKNSFTISERSSASFEKARLTTFHPYTSLEIFLYDLVVQLADRKCQKHIQGICNIALLVLA